MLILHVIGMPESSLLPGLPGATDHSEVLASSGLDGERVYKGHDSGLCTVDQEQNVPSFLPSVSLSFISYSPRCV